MATNERSQKRQRLLLPTGYLQILIFAALGNGFIASRLFQVSGYSDWSVHHPDEY